MRVRQSRMSWQERNELWRRGRANRWSISRRLSRGVARDETVRGIAARLHRAPSTISREIRRQGGARPIARRAPTGGRGPVRVGPRYVGWPRARGCVASLRRN